VIEDGRDVPVIPLPKAGIVLLFDTSGSMAWDHNGNVSVPVDEQRLTLAKRAATPFMDLLYDHGEGKANFGIGGFPRQPYAGCFGEEITEITPITISSHDTAVNQTIPNLEAAGATPLLAGMETAVAMFGPETPKVIVLLSDGYHNCPSYVEAGDEEFVDLVADLTAKSISVYIIGFARPGDVDHHFLDEIATATTGQFHDVTSAPGFNPHTWHPATDLQGTYKSILADGLGLEMIADPLGMIKGGQTEIHEVRINENDEKISFFLSWVTPDENRLGLAIRSSDGQEIPAHTTPGVLRHEGSIYKIVTVDSSFLKHPGKVGPEPWTIEIDSSQIDGNEQECYQYSVIADSRLKMRTALDKASYQTGEVVTLTARITEAGQPLTGLDDVKVKITRPKDGAGNWFAMNKVSAKELEPIPENLGAENLSPAHRKAIFLSEVRKVAFPARTGPTALQLYDDGTHGDVTAGDGTYTNRFMDTSREGTYAFRYHATGPTSGGNAFDREDTIQKYITVNVVSESIRVSAARLPSVKGKLRQFSIVVTPKDSLGNYLGPRYSKMIKTTASQGRFINVVQDNLDGTYSQTLQLPPSADPRDVDISVNVKDAAVSLNLAEMLAKPYRISFHVGGALPLGSFDNSYDPGYSIGLNFDYRFTSHFSFVGLLGYNQFESGTSSIRSTYWWNISANVKYEFTANLFRPYIQGGPGIYVPKTGSTKLGFNAGLGVDYSLARNWTVELGGDYHHVFTSGSNTQFIVPRIGVTYRF
jgi:opacity protein-like surface antigen